MRRSIQFKLGGLIYIAMMLFIGAAAMNSRTNLLYLTFGMMAGGLILSSLIARWMLSRVALHRIVADSTSPGHILPIEYRLTNPKRMMPCFALVIEELDAGRDGAVSGNPSAWVMHIGPGRNVRTDACAWPLKRGVIQFNRIRLSTTFPFGLFKISTILRIPRQTVIHPVIHPVRPRALVELSRHAPSTPRWKQVPGDGEEFFAMREYREGDPLKSIEWKRSAHAGKTLVRQNSRPAPRRLMLCLDLDIPAGQGPEMAERAITLGASLLKAAFGKGYEVGVWLGRAGDGEELKTSRDIQTCLDHLGRLKLKEGAEAKHQTPHANPTAGLELVVVHTSERRMDGSDYGQYHCSASDDDRLLMLPGSQQPAGPSTEAAP